MYRSNKHLAALLQSRVLVQQLRTGVDLALDSIMFANKIDVRRYIVTRQDQHTSYIRVFLGSPFRIVGREGSGIPRRWWVLFDGKGPDKAVVDGVVAALIACANFLFYGLLPQAAWVDIYQNKLLKNNFK